MILGGPPCLRCGALLWRCGVQQVEVNKVPAGAMFTLWPDPNAICASFSTATGYTQPVAFCRDCVPALDEPCPTPLTAGGLPIEAGGCVSHITTRERYASTLTRAYGAWLSVHLRDQLRYDDAMANEIMAAWTREAAEVR